MRKIILKNGFALGDVVLMTAAVRDLHLCYPGQFQTDVRTHFPDVWDFNPHLTHLEERDPDVQVIQCQYPLIDFSNSRPYHVIHGYIDFLNRILGLDIKPTAFHGDIHLSEDERNWASQVHELTGSPIPFWIVSAGGKYDITIKWWSTDYFQSVVDHFKNQIAFVQIGEFGHHHPKLRGAIDLRGQTSVRELIRLVHHAQGVLSPVTALMHLAAAVETKPGFPKNRPCVVVAGGREPPHWESYPHHQFIHSVGALPCCAEGGCWKSRTYPLIDGDRRDTKANLCVDVVESLPRCMMMITPEEVIRRITMYYSGGMLQFITTSENRAKARGIKASQTNDFDQHSINRYNAPSRIAAAIESLPNYPGGFHGRGIVICAGGIKYFTCAWVCINMIRRLGCTLPIELWFQGPEELDQRMAQLLQSLGVRCVDAKEVEKRFPRRCPGGWELKSYAIIHSSFEEVLLLDADNVPCRNPAFLFDETEYRRTGSIFWPDYGTLGPDRAIWSICDIDYREESEFESGQMLINKRTCWKPLALTFWFNEHSDFFYYHIHGDKDTFHLAWRKLKQPYTMVTTPIESLEGVMCQHDLRGQRIFQHRNSHKWQLFSENRHIRGFLHEKLCLSFLEDLREKWDGRIRYEPHNCIWQEGLILRGDTCDSNIFNTVVKENQYQLPERFHSTDVVIDVGAHVGSFAYACNKRGARTIVSFEPDNENFKLAWSNLKPLGPRVRVYEKAVWRSDRHPTSLIHSGYNGAGHTLDTGSGTVLVQGEEQPSKVRNLVSCIGLDKILQRFQRVRLLKLACAGAEWPILFTSKELGRVEAICGKYQEVINLPSYAVVQEITRYRRTDLEQLLKRYYHHVQFKALANNSGLFWAWDRISR
jgi:FkbM family methyltransferase